MKKREVLEVIVQRETKAAQKHCRTARADFLKNTETVRLAFTEFVHVALMFQLEKHQEFLEGFLKLFRAVDTDLDGVVNEAEFIQLIDKMQIGLNVEQT